MGQSMGKKLSNKELQLYSQQTQLQPHVIQQLYEAFIDRTGKKGRMTINEFKLAYTQINPYANIYNIDMDAERVFLMFDNDRNGKNNRKCSDIRRVRRRICYDAERFSLVNVAKILPRQLNQHDPCSYSDLILQCNKHDYSFNSLIRLYSAI
ncbi:unnamed protein product [Rotaria socialis]|uniref:EF-hand domain-containing protein n=1 Tax=Rotaria socialis TaxID=392032 RepID=A0A821N8A4_9BILA|nr:unnamed protein product [Rotaria socialis]